MKRGKIDWYILIPVLLLVCIGLIMVLSASSAVASANYGKPYYFFRKQVMWSIFGLAGMFFAANYKYTRLKKLAGAAAVATAVLLIALLIPGVASNVNGANSWIQFAGASFQPSELVKLCTVLILAKVLANKRNDIKSFQEGLLPPLIIIAVVCLLIVLERDLGTTMALAFTSFTLLFLAGARILHLSVLAGCGGLAAFGAIWIEPYRFARLTAFWNPMADPKGTGYQILQSLYAIGSGGLIGVGLGQGKQKFLYLPESHTDFIFSILSEEMGFIGGVIIIVLFVVLLARGLKIAYSTRDSFGKLLAAGITTMIAVEAIMNISVATSSMPVTGITLPFISYGGSSLFFKMIAVGVLLNISRYAPKDQEDKDISLTA